ATVTTAPQRWQRYRRTRTTTMTGGSPGLQGPRNCRSRSPCPCSPCGSPGGLPAAPHSGHRPGRTASTDGGPSSHLLMSTSLRAIDLSAPHPRMITTAAGPRPEERCSAPPVTYFWPLTLDGARATGVDNYPVTGAASTNVPTAVLPSLHSPSPS